MGIIYVSKPAGVEQVKGSDGKMYDRVWKITRKFAGNMQMLGATVNGELRRIDLSVPLIVDRLPRDVKSVNDALLPQLYNSDSWVFGEY